MIHLDRVLQHVTLVMLVGSSAAQGADLTIASRRADFERLVRAVEEDYVYLQDGGHCWADVRVSYAARVDEADTDDAWRRVLEDALDELHDFHAGINPESAAVRWAVPSSADLWAHWQGDRAIVTAVRAGSDAARAGARIGDEVVRVNGVPVLAAAQSELHCNAARKSAVARRWALLTTLAGRRGAARQLDLRTATGATRTIDIPSARRFERATQSVTTQRLSADAALIRLNNSLGQQETVAAFDAALATVRDLRGLILDLRDVPSGGNSSVALGIMGRFVATRMPYQRHRIPNFGQSDVERNWVEEVQARGPFTYDGRLVVLVDAWTGSMGEGIAIGLDGMKRATVVGSAMAELAGAVERTTLPASGISVQFPVEQLFHLDGSPRHRWRPPVEVNPANGRDVLLDRARAALQSVR